MKSINSDDRFRRQFLDFILLGIAYVMGKELSGLEVGRVDLLIVLILGFVWYLTSRKTELYDDFRTSRYISELLTLMPNILVQAITVFSLSFFMSDGRMEKGSGLFYILFVSVFTVIGKYLFKQYKLYRWSKGKDTRNILIAGNGHYAKELHGLISESKQFGYNLIGIINDTPPKYVKENYLGKLTKAETIIADYQVDEMIICTSDASHATLDELLDISDRHAVKVRIIPEYFKFNSSRFKMDMFGSFPMVTVRVEPLEQYQFSLLKRICDVLFTAFLFVFVFSWLFPIIAIAIKLDSAGPVFYLQDRWGKGGNPFKCFKFRTMRHNSSTTNTDGSFFQTTKNDPRITRVGAFLRRTNFDELPQFINVLFGDMSVVGPRPHAVKHSIETREKIPHYLLRHLVKPGITGWAQANGYRGETSNDFLMEKRVELDIWYVENWSFWLDLKIVLMTAYNMIKGEKMAY
jgi:putative colanic acid biosynthesis UDP-glucose lipid carrier transferase